MTQPSEQRRNRQGAPCITILMAVYDGGAALQPQLDSIAAQSHAAWRLVASDDGSTDDSRAVLDRFAQAHPVTRLDGPGQGGSANFMSLLRRAEPHVGADGWIAFCDQDDIWLPDRLERGVAALTGGDPERPALFCSRTWITDDAGRVLRLSPPRPLPLGFRNALVQNVASGNTILLNPAAARLAMAAAHEAERVVVHDWWLYQIVSGAGGRLVHDDAPTLHYRQHPGNQIGANDTARARLKRIRQLLRGDFRDWNETNIAALSASAHRLTPENRALLEGFAALRRAGLAGRLRGLRRLGLYRQSRTSTAALWLSAALGRL